jgi:hypothetical protein
MSDAVCNMLLTTASLAIPMLLVAWFAINLTVDFDREGDE